MKFTELSNDTRIIDNGIVDMQERFYFDLLLFLVDFSILSYFEVRGFVKWF